MIAERPLSADRRTSKVKEPVVIWTMIDTVVNDRAKNNGDRLKAYTEQVLLQALNSADAQE